MRHREYIAPSKQLSGRRLSLSREIYFARGTYAFYRYASCADEISSLDDVGMHDE